MVMTTMDLQFLQPWMPVIVLIVGMIHGVWLSNKRVDDLGNEN